MVLKLILYGLGQGLNLVEERVKKEHKIIGYMDSYAKISIFRGKPFYTLKDISQIHFDYIIVTIQCRKTALEIYHMLITQYGIHERCIIPFYVYANYENYRIKLKRCNIERIRGLIFGNSHAECGYLEGDLYVPFLNLAVSTQDIYHNYITFQSCIQEQGKRLRNLSYIIIDLYDYYCFNCDTSMTRYMIDYILRGGYLDEHNFKYNRNYKKSFREELLNVAYIPEKTPYLCSLFDDVNVRCGVRASDRWKHTDKDEWGPMIKRAALNRHEATIEENKKLLHLFLQEIKDFNSNIRIIFTLIPRYIKMEQETKLYIGPWEQEFHDIINYVCEKYNVLFWNYKNRTEISSNEMFYYDISHLNTTGARALTSILNEDLKNIDIL